MSVELWTIIMVGLSFLLYIYIGWRSRDDSSGFFVVAGQGVPALANGAATAADWMSAASFISMAGLISFLGYDGSIYLMGWTGGYVLLALLPVMQFFGGELNAREKIYLLCNCGLAKFHLDARASARAD